jgi:hypothetical protein
MTALAGLGAASLAFAVRAWVPPAPLFVARATLARDVAEGEPLQTLGSSLRPEDVSGLVAFTAVYAPAGLRQPIAHVWRREGRIVSVVQLSPVRGGRREGFRTYSRKIVMPPDARGRWTVDVVTDSGQLIGRLRFRVKAP